MATQTGNQNSSTKPQGPGKPRGNPGKDQEKKPEVAAKRDKERSDWEGMTPKPEQQIDDVASPGQLPETD